MDGLPPTVWMPGGVRTDIHLAGNDTNGTFCLLVDHPPAGWALPAHLHRGIAETIHVIEGEFEMTVGGQVSYLATGQTVHVPPGVVHEGRSVSDTTGKRLLIFSPAGMEKFFLEAGAESAEAEFDLGSTIAAAMRHGWEFVT